jgi:hypothetical protein
MTLTNRKPMSDYPEIDYSAVAKSIATDYASEVFMKKQYENIIGKLKEQRDSLQIQLNNANARLAATYNDEAPSGSEDAPVEPI